MPAATEYSLDPKALDNEYRSELLTRVTAIDAAWKYYKGDMKEPLLRDGTSVNDNILLPLCTALIDKAVATMMGTDEDGILAGVAFNAANAEFQPHLDALWEVNGKNKFLHNTFLTASLTGHVFVKIVPEAFGTLPRFVLLDPRNVSVFWHAADAARVLWYRVQYGMPNARRRKDIVRDLDEWGGDAGTWTIYSYQEGKEGRWTPADEPLLWPKPWAPILDWQNLPIPAMGGYYGRDDLGILPKMNDAINFTVSNMQRIQKHHGHPQMVVSGGHLDNDFVSGPDQIIDGLPADASVYNVEMQSEGQFALALLQFLQRQFYNSGREVDPATVADKLGDLTNFGLRLLYSDSVTKRQVKWLEAADGLRRLSQYSLELMGHGENIPLNVIPPSPLPQNPTEQANALNTDVQNGLSQTTYLQKRGYDPAQESALRNQGD
jgi:hypothetical protein